MKSYRKELWFNIPGRRGFVNITPDVETCLRDSGIREGLVLCNAMHIIAKVTINENVGLRRGQLDHEIDKAVPWRDPNYFHGVGQCQHANEPPNRNCALAPPTRCRH